MKDNILRIHSTTTEQEEKRQLRALKGFKHTWLPNEKEIQLVFLLKQLERVNYKRLIGPSVEQNKGLFHPEQLHCLVSSRWPTCCQEGSDWFQPWAHLSLKNENETSHFQTGLLLADADSKYQKKQKALPFSTDWEFLTKHNNHILTYENTN